MVSIHAPAWGAMEPRRHNRCSMSVSIHAPAWGATPEIVLGEPEPAQFQSTPPRGGRPADANYFMSFWEFQSTPPRGGRRGRFGGHGAISRSFNPRPRVGGDESGEHGRIHLGVVSIHAPAWGATRSASMTRALGRAFQSTPPRGGRRR